MKRNTNILLQRFFRIFQSDSIFLRMIPLFFFIYLIAHIVACIFHFMAYYTEDYDTWLVKSGYHPEPPIDRYLVSLYFVSQTVKILFY